VDNISTALLTIKDLHNDVLKDTYHQSCKKTFAAYFKSFKESKTKNLVIDLRDNQGGDIENGEELLSYLLDNPFNILEKGPTSGIINPKENAFSGKVFVLINGGSFSNSGIISSYLQKVKRAVFIGEEAGGNRAVLNGNPKTGILPNTKIYYEIPSAVYLMRTDIKNDGHGTFPDYEIHSSAEDIIAKKDKVKEFALSLIQKN
jgi:C-terminal processing protease CtpA/Prc